MTERLALVTGATGFIGSRLVLALVTDGWAVRATGRRERPAAFPDDVEYRAVDLVEGSGQTALCTGVTHLFHLAGASSSLSDEAGMQRANVVATERLLAAVAPGAMERVLYMSSTSVYGEEIPLPVPVREDVELHPSRPYGKAKWRTEQVVWAAGEAGLPVLVVRPVSVYGPANVKLLASAVLDVAIERFAGQQTIFVPPTVIEQRLVHINDVIRACLHLARHPRSVGQAYNVVFPSYPSSHQVAAILADELGMAMEVSTEAECGLGYEERATTRHAMLAAGMGPDILLTKERFRFMGKVNPNNRLSVDALLATGFRFDDANLETGIRSTIGWYRDQRWIV